MNGGISSQLLVWYIGISANVLPIILGIWAWPRLTRTLRAIWATFVISLAIALLSSGVIMGFTVSGQMLNYVVPFFYALLYASAFSMVIQNQRLHRAIWAVPLLIGLTSGLIVLLRGIETFYMWAYVASDSWVIVLSLIWFYEQLTRRPNDSLRATPWFWINTMLLLEKLYSLFFAFTGQWLYGYHEQLFTVLFYGVSPLIIWGNAIMACVGIWKQQQLTRRPVGSTVLT